MKVKLFNRKTTSQRSRNLLLKSKERFKTLQNLKFRNGKREGTRCLAPYIIIIILLKFAFIFSSSNFYQKPRINLPLDFKVKKPLKLRGSKLEPKIQAQKYVRNSQPMPFAWPDTGSRSCLFASWNLNWS